MPWLDNLIARISPEAAYRREAWRYGLRELREYYDSGSHGRLNASWNVFNESAEATDQYARDTIRARARDLERNSDIMNSLTGAFKRNVVGEGYILQARGSDNEEINSAIEEYWRQWTKKRNCDVTGTQSFNQILRMAEERKRVDGGMLIYKVYSGGGLIPFKLQCLEVDELDITQNVPKFEGNKVVSGIEFNEHNRAVGYWIKQYTLDGYSEIAPRFIRETDMIYIFTKKRPSQIREISDMTATLTEIRDTNEFKVAVSVKQRIEACLSVFVKRAIPNGSIGRGTTHNPDRLSYDGKTLTPGMIRDLNPGDEVQVVNPNGQASDATQYVKLQERTMAAGQGLSYETTSRDMSQSTYSSARQGSIEDELTYVEDREILMEAMDEIYETFVISLVLAGLVSIPDFWDKKELYFKHVWIRAPKKWIDPAKESNANKTALASGQKTFRDIAAENGKDWKEQINDMRDEIEYAESQGVDLGGMVYGIKKDSTGN